MKLVNEHSSEEENKYEDSTSALNESTPIMNTEKNTIVSPETKNFLKRFLEQSRGTALGGAVIINHAIFLLGLTKPVLTVADHQRLTMGLFGFWGLRGGSALALELTGLKDKADIAIPVYSITEKNIIRMLAIVSFLRKMPIPTNYNFALQIAFASLVLFDQGLSVKALIEDKPDPLGACFSEIQSLYGERTLLTVAATLKEMLSRAMQTGPIIYNAGYVLADIFVDTVSPQDPSNQQEILMILALIFSCLAAASVMDSRASKINDFIQWNGLNTGFVFFASLTLIYLFFTEFFNDHSLAIGLILLALEVAIPAILKLMVIMWENQEKNTREPSVVPVSIFNNKEIATERKSLQGEMRSTLEEVLANPLNIQKGSNYDV